MSDISDRNEISCDWFSGVMSWDEGNELGLAQMTNANVIVAVVRKTEFN